MQKPPETHLDFAQTDIKRPIAPRDHITRSHMTCLQVHDVSKLAEMFVQFGNGVHFRGNLSQFQRCVFVVDVVSPWT